ncbi:hypothetical protein DNTS_017961 [Danionella cerebrum]|uniref:Uncharacterized protein n=1 Tax=Danionella cerebrum TaxID=2873325 RepID=A0A553Q632_9TELE|nr:hypothetical protein DNTS_017961 [Danionella translucida]
MESICATAPTTSQPVEQSK